MSRGCAVPAGVLCFLIVIVLAPCPAAAQEAVEYYATDALGSVRVVFASNGTVKGRMDFGPYGEQLSTAEGIGQKVFAQITFDGESAMDYAEARMFQIRTGRFNAPDAIFNALEQPQAWNRYTYALNSPLVFTDTTGLNADACEGWIGDASSCVSGNPSRIDPLWSMWTWTWGGHGWTIDGTEGGGGVFLPPPQTTPPGPQPATQGPVDPTVPTTQPPTDSPKRDNGCGNSDPRIYYMGGTVSFAPIMGGTASAGLYVSDTFEIGIYGTAGYLIGLEAGGGLQFGTAGKRSDFVGPNMVLNAGFWLLGVSKTKDAGNKRFTGSAAIPTPVGQDLGFSAGRTKTGVMPLRTPTVIQSCTDVG
jgi:RHS repeat-associated protein